MEKSVNLYDEVLANAARALKVIERAIEGEEIDPVRFAACTFAIETAYTWWQLDPMDDKPTVRKETPPV